MYSAILLSIISILIGFLISFFFSERRRLTIVYLGEKNLANISNISKKLTLLYNKEDITSLYVTELLFCNNGNKDIKLEYTREAPHIILDNNRKILDVFLLNPSFNSKINFKIDNNIVYFEVEYLKKDHKGAVQILTTSTELPYNNNIISDLQSIKSGTIEDTKVTIEPLQKGFFSLFFISNVFMLIFSLGLLIFLKFFPKAKAYIFINEFSKFILSVLITLIVVSLSYLVMFIKKEMKRKFFL